MSPEMKALIELQEVELTIRRLEEQDRENNADLIKKKKEAEELENQITVSEQKDKEYKTKIHDLEVDHQALQDTMNRYTEQRNYIKKPRELVAIDKEIEATLKSIRINETETAKIQKEYKEFLENLATLKERLKIKKEEISILEERNREQNNKNAALLAETNKTRKEIIERIPKDLLETYNYISANKEGRALAEVIGEACGGCFISLPPQVINEIRKGDQIIRCFSCSRILYLKN